MGRVLIFQVNSIWIMACFKKMCTILRACAFLSFYPTGFQISILIRCGFTKWTSSYCQNPCLYHAKSKKVEFQTYLHCYVYNDPRAVPSQGQLCKIWLNQKSHTILYLKKMFQDSSDSTWNGQKRAPQVLNLTCSTPGCGKLQSIWFTITS